jgi:hypothetical protein
MALARGSKSRNLGSLGKLLDGGRTLDRKVRTIFL